jgi:SecD/SecF fusion protein
MRRTPIAHIANVSLWETIRRSLATTFITMLPLLALYFFGGETLKDFAFALLIGIGSGAYSSIFIAAPVVAMLKEREPEYARLKDGVGVTPERAAASVEAATDAAADQPVPELVPVAAADSATKRDARDDKRERRRQRRRSRPHGRAR